MSGKKEHSAKWWRNHWDVRDRCGSYTDLENLSKGDGDHCKREDGHQAERAKKRDPWGRRHNKAAAPAKKRRSAGPTRAELRDVTYDGQHAQSLRAEAASGGNKRELRAFYGSAHESPDERAERRITTAAADKEARALRAHEREQAEAYRERQKAKKAGAKKAGGRRFADWYLGKSA